VYDNRVVLAVLIWAALHERSVSWACQRRNWPVQAWRRRLPDQSTLSRRLRAARVLEDLERLVAILQRNLADGSTTLVVDGKPLAVSEFTSDPEAVTGWGAGRHAKGYKLHALIDSTRRLLAWDVRPMKDSEQAVACELVARAAARGVLPRDGELLGDSNYDSRHLYTAASSAGLRLIAPRRVPGTGFSNNPGMHPDRRRAVADLEGDTDYADRFRARRTTIERYFGVIASAGGGLYALPAWARRLHRVRAWVGAKLALLVARTKATHNSVVA
jgi:hypothetical protein